MVDQEERRKKENHVSFQLQALREGVFFHSEEAEVLLSLMLSLIQKER